MADMLSFNSDPGTIAHELADYVAIPSVSRDASADIMRSAATWLTEKLNFADARIESTAGHPVVRADWIVNPELPTILVYGHYDVQPTGDLAEWRTPPFELHLDGDVFRGRGVTDDKGPVYIVCEVARAFFEQEGAPPLNVRFLFEGEEEIGSPHLPEYVRSHAAELSCDLVVSADGAMWRASEPSLSIMSKGLISFTLHAVGANRDLHSGRFGGTVANPFHAMADLLASMHTDDGAVSIPHFYDGVPPLKDERRAELSRIPFDDEDYRRDLGVEQLFGEAGLSTLERLWERPTLEINGVDGGGKYTVIPHHARAYLSARLVPGQDPQRVSHFVREYVEHFARPGVRFEVEVDDGAVPAYTIAPHHPAINAARAALSEVYPDQTTLLTCIAGTLPATTLFETVLGAKTLFFSFSTADEYLHAPNEFMRVRRFGEGMKAWEFLWRHLATSLKHRKD